MASMVSHIDDSVINVSEDIGRFPAHSQERCQHFPVKFCFGRPCACDATLGLNRVGLGCAYPQRMIDIEGWH